jgi:3,4-dihydroxy 2-butanone 4-phosphate synthase/GTP cyclohydrolase II
MVKGEIGSGEDILVRVHTQCLSGDVFGATTCHCQAQMDRALETIDAEGRGVLLYLARMGKSGELGLPAELEVHAGKGAVVNETIGFAGEQREYGIGAQILAALNVRSMRILSNHPRKLVALEAYGLRILTQVPLSYQKTSR